MPVYNDCYEMKPENGSIIFSLDGKKLGAFSLSLESVKQLRLSGWQGFTLILKRADGRKSLSPVIKGIYSSGGKDGVQPWMDLDYREETEFLEDAEIKKKISLGHRNLDQVLFHLLGNLIPPGGHLMVSYEGNQNIHMDTVRSLNIKIPPAATPLGFLLFKSGFQLIKDWYLSEGGFEGPRKLWAEKAPNKEWALTFYRISAGQLREFLKLKERDSFRDLDVAARIKASEILDIIASSTGESY